MDDEEAWQDTAAAQLMQRGAYLPIDEENYGAPPIQRPPLPRERPTDLPIRRPDAISAGAAPIARIPAEVYKEFQRRMEYFESLKKQGIPENQLPNMGYVEGQTMPAYRPPGGLDYRMPGSLQRQFDELRPYVLPEELDYKDTTRELGRQGREEYEKRYGRRT